MFKLILPWLKAVSFCTVILISTAAASELTKSLPVWTIDKIIWVTGGLLGVIFATLFGWKYRRISRLNKTLLEELGGIKNHSDELRTLEEKFRGIFDHSSTAIVSADNQGKLTLWNDAFRTLLGYDNDDLKNISFKDLTHPEDIESSRDYLGKIFRGEINSFRIVKRWIRKNRSVCWGEISVARLTDSSGEVTGVIANILDINELKIAEEKLKTREEQLRDFGAAAADWYWEMDEDLRFSYFSERMEEVTGVDPEYFSGKTRQETGNPGIGPEEWKQHLDDLACHRPFRQFVHPRTRVDGSVVWLAINGRPVFDIDGCFTGYRGTGMDITEARTSQQRLLDLSSAIDQMTEPVVVFDKEDRFIFTNQAYRHLNHSAIETIQSGMGFRDHIKSIVKKGLAPDSLGREQEWIDERMERHLNPSGYFELKRQDGTWFLGIEKKLPSGGQVLLLTDISKIKENQEELVKAKEEAEFASQAKTEFLSSMSHELRTPMNAILGFAQLLRISPREPLTEKQQSSVDKIINGGNHLLELINQVLELSQIEVRKSSLNFDHVCMRDVVGESLKMIRARADQSEVQILDYTAGESLPLLWTDSTRLTQILLNLLSNAVKYNRHGGSVTLTCRQMSNQMLRLFVADTGSGIPDDKRDNLFKPFERLGRESGKIEGTGIGLTITQQLIQLLGGQVGYDSEEGKGSTFWIDIPISNKGFEIEKKPDIKETVQELEEINNDDEVRTILYIEDNPDNMVLMETILEEFDNVKMLSAFNAELGVDIAKSESPDLILMDLNLPGMNGIQALKCLQSIAETKDIPVIAFTAAAMPKDVKAGMDAGFREYITKPINVSDFIEAINKIFA